MRRKCASPVIVLVLVTGSFCLFLSTIPNEVSATTHYVGGVGPGNHTTIQGAIDSASPGDTIFVYSGTYSENVAINKTVSLVGEDLISTFIDAGGTYDVVNVTANWTNITSLSITNSGGGSYDAGIELFGVRDCRISGNRIFGNEMGMSLHAADGNIVSNNNVSGNVLNIALRHSHENRVLKNNLMYSTTWVGMFLWHADGNIIDGNNISGNARANLDLRYSDHNYLGNNTASNSSDGGMYIFESSNNILFNNNFVNNDDVGIQILNSNNVMIAHNNVSWNNRDGIGIYSSTHIIVENNTIYANNPVDVNIEGSSNISVFRNDIIRGSVGIWLQESDNLSIVSNTIAHMRNYGIQFWTLCSYINISGNLIYYTGWEAIYVSGSSNNNTIADNNIYRNTNGVMLWRSDNNTISNNYFSWNTETGVDVWRSYNNTIIGNTFRYNENCGLLLKDSYYTLVHHNSFIQNWVHAGDDTGANEWDNGYPSGGNYWSNHTTIDIKSGPNQDQEGSDGIGDTPLYVVTSGVDRYPLYEPVEGINNPPIASFTLAPVDGDISTVFVVDAVSSFDPEDLLSDLEIRWDWEDDGAWDTTWSSAKTAQHQYSEPGTYTIRLEVKDTGGLTDSKTRQVLVTDLPANQPPTCTIDGPISGSTISNTSVVEGSATDFDGVIVDVEVRIDNGSWMQASGLSSWMLFWDTTSVSNGEHTIHARSYDGTQYSTVASVEVTVHNIPIHEPDAEEKPDGIWPWLAVIIILLSVSLILIILLVSILRKRRKVRDDDIGEK